MLILLSVYCNFLCSIFIVMHISQIFHSRSIPFDARVKLSAFDNQTTYENDYRFNLPKQRTLNKWPQDKAEKAEKASRPYHSEDHETFIKRREGSYLPFNMLWEPKPITGTNSHESRIHQRSTTIVEEPNIVAIVDKNRKIFAPTVCLENIKDPGTRSLVIKRLYTTDWSRAVAEATPPKVSQCKRSEASAGTIEDHLRFEPDLFPPCPKGWRSKAKDWDTEQPRAEIDNTEQFWLRRPLPEEDIMASEKLVTNEVKEEIHGLIIKEKLRMPHDKLNPTYTGYRTSMPYGVDLRKPDWPIEHPMVTTNQSIAIRQGYQY